MKGIIYGLAISLILWAVIICGVKAIFGEETKEPNKVEIVFTPEQIDMMKAQGKVNQERFLQNEKTRLQERLNTINSAINAISDTK